MRRTRFALLSSLRASCFFQFQVLFPNFPFPYFPFSRPRPCLVVPVPEEPASRFHSRCSQFRNRNQRSKAPEFRLLASLCCLSLFFLPLTSSALPYTSALPRALISHILPPCLILLPLSPLVTTKCIHHQAPPSPPSPPSPPTISHPGLDATRGASLLLPVSSLSRPFPQFNRISFPSFFSFSLVAQRSHLNQPNLVRHFPRIPRCTHRSCRR